MGQQPIDVLSQQCQLPAALAGKRAKQVRSLLHTRQCLALAPSWSNHGLKDHSH